MAFQNPELLN